MKFYVKVSKEKQYLNMIQGVYENQQPEQLPQIEVNDDYVDYFKQRYFEFYFVEGKLIESQHRDFKNFKLKKENENLKATIAFLARKVMNGGS